MQQRYIWAILSLVAGLLIYYLFHPVDRHIITASDIDNHAHITHYYFAEPKRIYMMFPEIIEGMRLRDAWVQGQGDQAMEVYDMPANTSIKMMGLQNISVIVTADVKRRQSMHKVTVVKDLIWASAYWQIEESGPTRMRSLVKQDVTVCLPNIVWTFVPTAYHDMVNTKFAAALEKAKVEIEAKKM